jgi:DHA1 family multidrug resistance protein-like MFS transporter
MQSLAIIPPFARYIYENIMISYYQTLFRAIAIVSVSYPLIFNFNGRQIRANSTFAPTPDIEQD